MSRKPRRLGFFRRSKVEAAPGLDYRLRGNIFSPEQASYLSLLTSAAGADFIICPRVSLTDIFYIPEPEKNRHLSSAISNESIDFLLCDPDTLLPLVGVDLVSKPEMIDKSVDQDFFIEDIFEAAKLPLLRIFTSSPCDVEYLRERLLDAARRKITGEPETRPREVEPAKEESQPRDVSQLDPQPDECLPEALVWLEEEVLLRQPEEPDKFFCEPALKPEISPGSIGRPFQEHHQDTLSSAGEPNLAGDELPGEEFSRVPDPTGEPYLPKYPVEQLKSEAKEETAAATSMVEKPEPLATRFMYSEPEQTPGIDFFTGQFYAVEPLPYAGSADGASGKGEQGVGTKPKLHHQRDQTGLDPSPYVSDIEELKAKTKQKVEEAAREALKSAAPECPRCTAAMVLRTSRRGYRFYLCTNYPYCREVKGLYE